MDHTFPRYPVGQEIANSVTHGLGVLFSSAAIALLAYRAALFGDGWTIASCIVYGVTLFMLYTASTLYHAIPFPRAKRILKMGDHMAIYFLIAGTYTPFALITLRGHDSWVGWIVFAIEWVCALSGCIFKVFSTGKLRLVSTLFYVAMGWVAVFTIGILKRELPAPGFWLLVAGGVTYTAGAVFYIIDRKVPYFHAVWHLFVLAGSILHFLSIFIYVIPGGE